MRCLNALVGRPTLLLLRAAGVGESGMCHMALAFCFLAFPFHATMPFSMRPHITLSYKCDGKAARQCYKDTPRGQKSRDAQAMLSPMAPTDSAAFESREDRQEETQCRGMQRGITWGGRRIIKLSAHSVLAVSSPAHGPCVHTRRRLE